MVNSNTNIYKMKREIITFSKKVTCGLSASNKKFFADMTYGILASQSCLLTKISHALQERKKKIYTVDRLSDHLKDGVDPIMIFDIDRNSSKEKFIVKRRCVW